MEQFLEFVQSAGFPGLVIGFAVLVAVYGLSRSGVVVTQGQKQLANVALSILLAGVQLLDPALDKVVIAAIASLGSALAYEGLRYLADRAQG